MGDIRRAGILDCSVSPTRSVQEGSALRERVSGSVYALTWRNRIITGFFITLTTAEAILGAIFMAYPDTTGKPLPRTHLSRIKTGNDTPSSPPPIAAKLPDIKLEPFYICLFSPNIRLESICMVLSLVFDTCAFIAIVVSAYKSLPPSSAKNLIFTGVVGTVVQDATIYFGLIFTSQFTVTMFCFFARVCCVTISFGVSDRVTRCACFL